MRHAQFERMVQATKPVPFTQVGNYAEAFADLALSPILDGLEADLAVLRARIEAACDFKQERSDGYFRT